MPRNLSDMERLMRHKSFNSVLVNLPTEHLRVNDVIDVWTSTRRWRRTKGKEKAKSYETFDDLEKIIFAELELVEKAQKSIAALPAAPQGKEPVRQLSMEEFKRRFS